MRLIIDPCGCWLGKPPNVLRNVAQNAPVAIDDTIEVFADSNPVVVDVLANDIDIDGGGLTIVSAYAALGTTTLTNGVLRYAPTPGLTDPDTIVYEIENAAGLRDTGQVSVNVIPPALAIERTSENRLEVTAANAPVDLTISDPPEWAATYAFDTSDFSGGPVSLAPCSASGIGLVGETISAAPGLWANDVAGGTPLQSWQWLRNGIPISNATAAAYVITPTDQGASIAARETLSDDLGQRSALSNSFAVPAAGFTPGDDSLAIAWWDADDATSLTLSGSNVTGWSDQISAIAVTQGVTAGQPTTGTRLLGGRNVLNFDGGDFLKGTVTLPASGDVAFHVVADIDAVSSGFAALFAVDATNDFQIDAETNGQFDGRLNATGIGTSVSLTGGPFSGPVIVSVIFDRTGTGVAEVFINNVSRGTMAYATAIDSTAALHLATNRSSNAEVQCGLAEVCITGDVTNRVSYHAYLSDKWGIS